MKSSQKFYLFFKRLIDICGAFIGIIVCSCLFWWWIIPINAIITKGHPVFSQYRVGKNGRLFKLFKFRSMRLTADPNATSSHVVLSEVSTNFGTFLRKLSLDETLQLLNIFAGSMSFIGPRPLIDVDEDAKTIALRKENGAIKLRPGISGYAQINGRTQLTPEEKANYDGYYYQHFSFWLDVKIFFISFFR